MAAQPPTTRAARLQRKQGPTESVRAFNVEIMRRIQECQITDGDRQLDIYIQNLREDIAQKVLLMMPQNLRQAQICADTVEHSLALTPTNPLLAISGQSGRRETYPNTRPRYDGRRDDQQSRSRGRSSDRQRSQSRSRDNRRSASRDRAYDDRRSASRDRDQQNSRGRQRSSERRPTRRDRSSSRDGSRDRSRRSPTPYHIDLLDDADHSKN